MQIYHCALCTIYMHCESMKFKQGVRPHCWLTNCSLTIWTLEKRTCDNKHCAHFFVNILCSTINLHNNGLEEWTNPILDIQSVPSSIEEHFPIGDFRQTFIAFTSFTSSNYQFENAKAKKKTEMKKVDFRFGRWNRYRIGITENTLCRVWSSSLLHHFPCISLTW